MQAFRILLAAAALVATASVASAQTSTVTNCMMVCNAQAASCQSSCLVPGTPPLASATITSNATASTACLLNCSTSQVACQTTCARQSPSQ
jgi:hypothetical protein